MKKICFSLSIVTTILITLLFSSCSKEQLTLNKLAGHWTYTSIKLLGVAVDPASLGYNSATLDFDLCKANIDLCGGTRTLNGVALGFRYKLSDDAKTVNVYNTAGGTDTYIITSLDKSNLVYTTTLSGIVYEFTLKK